VNIELANGKTISISTYEWLFVIKDEDLPEFFQSCMADDLGQHIENPFSSKSPFGKLDVIEDEEVEEEN